MSSLKVPHLDLPTFDTLVDVVGNPTASDLHLFLNGNQFMVMEDLLAAFRAAYPTFSRIYYETLPPGILASQIQAEGRIDIGTLSLSVHADVYTAGRDEMTRLRSYLLDPLPYAANQLALLVQKENPKHITGFSDLGRNEVRVAMPNPETEGIARLARRALELVGGPALRDTVFIEKHQAGTTLFTTVHHRETVDWLERDRADVGVVWESEARFAVASGRRAVPLSLTSFKANPVGKYVAAGLKQAPHPKARDAFLAFLQSSECEAIYSRYGFLSPDANPHVFAGF